jgi:fatty-acyl-CoA synthase
MFISGGLNVYPAEIEGQLLLHPAIRDAAVVGVPDETWGEMGVAFVVAESDNPPSPDALQAFLLDRIARFKLPRDWRFVRELPRTALGKVMKGQLRDEYLAERTERHP